MLEKQKYKKKMEKKNKLKNGNVGEIEIFKKKNEMVEKQKY